MKEAIGKGRVTRSERTGRLNERDNPEFRVRVSYDRPCIIITNAGVYIPWTITIEVRFNMSKDGGGELYTAFLSSGSGGGSAGKGHDRFSVGAWDEKCSQSGGGFL